MKKILSKVPLYFYISAGCAAVSGVFYILFVSYPSFADWFNQNVSSFFRTVLAFISNFINFSVAEGFLLFSPVIAVVIAAYIIKKHENGTYTRLISFVLSVVFFAFSIFTINFAAGYRGLPLAQKLGIERRDVTPEELSATMEILKNKVNSLADSVVYDENGLSVLPFDTDELSAELAAAYNKVCEQYSFIGGTKGRLKPIMLSEPMTYTHISGVYTYFTGESNININYPDFVTAYTGAHELAHQRGIAREDEANFVAYLVCTASDNNYIAYSGYLNLYRYVASALAGADMELYSETADGLDRRVAREMNAFSSFFDKYRENIAADVSDKVNDTYLTSQGTQGSKSYGMVVDLAVAYLLDEG